MNDIWTILNGILDGILAFFDWFLHDTPLFEDTLDSFYAAGEYVYNILYPLLGEYIEYISEYIST